MEIRRKKDNINKTWKWQLVWVDPILSSPGKEVVEIHSTHNKKKEAEKCRDEIFQEIKDQDEENKILHEELK